MKYKSVRTYSELCQRTFPSKAEARRGEELRLLEMAGKIKGLEYQRRFVLCNKPKVSITIDFSYWCDAEGFVYEDTKGVLTRDFRTKLAWLKEKYNIDVILSGDRR